MRAVSVKRAAENRLRKKVLAEMVANEPWCARCGVWADVLDGHELLSRARGGSITDPDNIVLLCRPCHDDVTFRHHLIPDADRWVYSQFGRAS